MVDHRNTPRSKVAVPAGWFIVLSVVACVGAAGWLGVSLLGPGAASADDVQSASSPKPSASEPAVVATTPEPTASSPEPEPKPTASTPEPEPTATPVGRQAPVLVLNNTGIANLAGNFAGRVSGAGWPVVGRGNWRGQIEANTVYYPDGLQDQATLLAADVGIARVLPSIVPMRMDRLTVILSGPQQ